MGHVQWFGVAASVFALGCAANFEAAPEGVAGMPSSAAGASSGGSSAAGGAQGSKPGIACPHGRVAFAGLPSGTPFGSVSFSAVTAYYPHEDDGADVRPMVTGVMVNSEPSKIIWNFELTDSGPAEMIWFVTFSPLGPSAPTLEPSDSVTASINLVFFDGSGKPNEPIDASACSLFVDGAMVASWP